MLARGSMIAGMAIIATMILVAPAYACDASRFRCPPKATQGNPFSFLFGQDRVERPVQKRMRPRTRAPVKVAAPKRKPPAETPPAAAHVPAEAPAAVTPPAAAAAPSAAPPPAAPTPPPAVASAPTAVTEAPTPPALLAPLAPAPAATPSPAIAPLAPVMLTPPAELVRIIKQSELPDPTSGVVWIVSPNEVNHIDMQAGHVVLVTKGSETDLWSAPWFQRLLATIGGALAAASAFRLFFA